MTPRSPLRPTILALLQEGHRHSDIAKATGAGLALVGKVAKESGLRRGQGRRPGDRRDDVIALYLAGCPTKEIALAFDPPITLRSVQNYLREHRLGETAGEA